MSKFQVRQATELELDQIAESLGEHIPESCHTCVISLPLTTGGTELVAYQVSNCSSGKVGDLLPVHVLDENMDRASLITALTDFQVQHLRDHSNVMIQMLLPHSQQDDIHAYEQSGLWYLTDLMQLTKKGDNFVPFESGKLNFEPIDQPTPSFGKVLNRTYEGTQDMPELNGIRTLEEIYASYLHTGKERAWFLIHEGGEAAGVLMLSNSDTKARLDYIGLVPEKRGRTLGRESLAFAEGWFTSHHAEQATLTMDARNLPALKLYQSFGWQVRGSYHFLLKIL